MNVGRCRGVLLTGTILTRIGGWVNDIVVTVFVVTVSTSVFSASDYSFFVRSLYVRILNGLLSQFFSVLVVDGFNNAIARIGS